MASLSGKRLYYTINFVAGLAIFFFGYDQGMMGGVNTAPDYVRTMGLGYSTYEGPSEGYVATITNPTKQGGIVSIYYLGTLIGALMAGAIGDRIGRIKTMLIGSIWVLVGASLQCSAQNLAWMLCARLINGTGTGFLNAIVPVWSAEVATHTSRGAFIATEFTLNIFGVVVAYWLEFGMGFIGNGDTQIRWRFPIAFQIIPVLAFMFALIWMPESPRWLFKVGHIDKARDILHRIRSDEIAAGTSDLEIEIHAIIEAVKLEKAHTKRDSYWAMFWGIGSDSLHIARRVQLVIWLQVVQEWVGIAAIVMWAPTIFAQAGYSARKSQWLSGLNDTTYCLSTLIGVLTIDRWGRRVPLYWGSVGQGIAMILSGALGGLLREYPDKAAQYGGASAFFIFVFTAVFGATWLSIPWVYPTEIFPLGVRAKGNAWSVVGWSIGNGWLTLLNPVMFNAIQADTLYIFGMINFLSIPMVWAFYPETANCTLEEIDLLFSSESPFAWDEEANFMRLKATHAENSKDAEEDGSSKDKEAEAACMEHV